MDLKYANIRLRTAQSEDAETLMKWWNDGAVMEHAGFPNGLGISLEGVQKNILELSTNTSAFFIIDIDEIPVGEASYRIKGRVAYPGWKICDPLYQNKGYGSRMIKMILEHIFSRQDVHVQTVSWDTTLENRRAQHVYRDKIKARQTKVVENSFVDQLGRSRTAIWYELSREEFYHDDHLGKERTQ